MIRLIQRFGKNYPINKEFADSILKEVIQKFEDVMKYDRHNFPNN